MKSDSSRRLPQSRKGTRGRSPLAPSPPLHRQNPRAREYEERFELGALFEFSNIINASVDLRFILGHFLLTLMGKLLSGRGIVLLERKKHVYVIEGVKGLDADMVGREVEIRNMPRGVTHLGSVESGKHDWRSFFAAQGIHLIVPIATGTRVLGIAGLAPVSLRKKLSEKESTYIKSLANIAAAAIEKSLAFAQLADANRQLDGKVQELNTLFEVGKEFNALLEPERIYKLLMYSIMGQIGVNRFFIALAEDAGMHVVASRLGKEIQPELLRFFSRLTVPVTTASLVRRHDAPVRAMLEDLGIELLVPLQLQHQTRGLLGFGGKLQKTPYVQNDIDFLSSLGNLALISLENARLFREAIEKQKLEDELVIAKEIQKKLLPSRLPRIPHCELGAVNISSKQVGGDYYDVVPLGNSRFALAIGDVSGKGAPASLLMANLQATIRALIPLALPLPELTQRVNDLIFDSTSTDRFITFFWGIVDGTECSMRYVSAGHCPPFLFHADGSFERLEEGGLILGVMKTVVPYKEGVVSLRKGDVLLMFTDGVNEAMNSEDEEFGEERIEEYLRTHLHETPKALIGGIVEAVKSHSKGMPQSDDITMVVLKAVC